MSQDKPLYPLVDPLINWEPEAIQRNASFLSALKIANDSFDSSVKEALWLDDASALALFEERQQMVEEFEPPPLWMSGEPMRWMDPIDLDPDWQDHADAMPKGRP